MNDDNRRVLLAAAVAAALLLVVALAVGGLLALSVATGESSTAVSAATAQAGDPAPEPDGLVVHVASEGDASGAVGDRIVEAFRDRGKDVTVAGNLAADYDDPLLVVAVDRANLDRDRATRTAAVDVTFYYSTEGTAEPWRRYRAGGSVDLAGPGGLVVGELRHRDRTGGLTTAGRYRAGVYDAVAEAVLDNYRGALGDA